MKEKDKTTLDLCISHLRPVNGISVTLWRITPYS